MIKLLNLEFKRNLSFSTSYHKFFTCVKYPDFHIFFKCSNLMFLQTHDYYKSTIVNCNLCETIDINSRSDVRFQNILKNNIENIMEQLNYHFKNLKSRI